MASGTLSAPTTGPNVPELMARVGDPKLAFGQRLSSVGDVMRAASKQMLSALPKHVTPDRMIRVAMNCIRKNPKLLDCSPPSLFAAITEAATYGWELGGVLGHAYLVPYKDECVLIPGYKGLIDLCRRSGQVSTISIEAVHLGDQFSYSLGDEPNITHIPNDQDGKRDQKPITYVYAVVKLRDGGIQRSVWTAAKIDAHKEKYSQGWRRAETKAKDSPWHTEWETMAKKTVIRQMIGRGLVPLSAEYTEVVNRAAAVEDQVIDFSGLMPPGGGEDLRIVDENRGQGTDPLDALLDGLNDSQDRAAFYKKAINSTLDKPLLGRLEGVIDSDESLDRAERDLLVKKCKERMK